MKDMKITLMILTNLLLLSGCFSVDHLEKEESVYSGDEETKYAADEAEESTSAPATSGGSESSVEVGESSSTEEVSSSEETSTEESTVAAEASSISLTYNQKAQYLILYTNCINCHNNQRGIDFGDVDLAINNVEVAFNDFNIDASSGEDAVVDAAISSLVDLYRAEGNGGPFNRTGNDAIGTNMSSKSSISHSSQQRTNLDKLEEWIKIEHGL